MRTQSNSGFSLIEVTVGMALVAGMALTVSTMIQWQAKSSRGVASVMDRNEINTRLAGWMSDSTSCQKMFGSKQASPLLYSFASNPTTAPSTIELPVIYDGALGTSKFLQITPITATAGFSNLAVKIKTILLEPASNPAAAPTSAGGKLVYQLQLRVKLDKSQPGLAKTANGQDNVNIGGDKLRDIVVPVVFSVDPATQLISNCSANGNPSVNDCSAAGNGTSPVWDAAAQKMVCRKVSCDPGSFAAGSDSSGQIVCCANGTHYAGTLDSNPVCCDLGKTMNASGACTTSSSCTADAMTPRSPSNGAATDPFPKMVNPDGSSYCCERIKGHPGNTSTAQCSSDKYAEDGFAEGYNGVAIQTLSVMPHSIFVEVQGSGSAGAGGNCCKMVSASFRDVVTVQCGLYQKSNGNNQCVIDAQACNSAGRYVLNGNQCVTDQECFDAQAPRSGSTCDSCQNGDIFVPIGAGTNGHCHPSPNGGNCVAPQVPDGNGGCMY